MEGAAPHITTTLPYITAAIRCPWDASKPPFCSWPVSTCTAQVLPIHKNCDYFSRYSGEFSQALRVLTLCGKGRKGAVASETA
jgi:hypothetical protein